MNYKELLKSECIDELLKQADSCFFNEDEQKEKFCVPLYSRIVELEPTNAYAINKIGNCYFNGIGVEKNEIQAKKYYTKAADLDFPPAQYNLASMLENEGNPACIELYKKSTRDGDGEGYYRVARIYDKGKIIYRDIAKAMEYLEKAAEMNFTSAQLDYAIELLEGKNVPQDVERGVSLMFQAANAGDEAACRNMAILFKNQKYLPRNMDNAIQWAKKASDMDEHIIIEEIALDYLNGEDGLEVNKPLAIELFKYAADRGSSVSAENMARCYLNGEVVEIDAETSKKYAIKAAHLGSIWAHEHLEEICDDAEYIEVLKYTADEEKYYSAMMELHRCYEQGKHVDKDEAISRHYLEEALKDEYSDALISYGLCRYFGELGYTEDVQAAIESLKKRLIKTQ